MTWHDLPAKLKIYIVGLTLFAIPIIIYACWDISHTTYKSGWIVLTILTVLTVPFYLLLPSVSTIVGIGDAYVMSIAMLYGIWPCIIATLFHSLAGSLFVPNRPKIYLYRVVFNISSTICCAFAYGSIFRFMTSTPIRSYTEIIQGSSISNLILAIAALTITFFLLNSFSTAAAICLANQQKILKFWVKNYLSLGVEFSVSSVSAGLIVGLAKISEWYPIAAAPLIGVVWGWNKINKAKTMEAEQHLKEQEQLYLRTVESLALAVDAKDQTTYGHIRRVKAYALGLAKLCGISDANELMAIETGSLLHDIGKLAIEDYILNKPGKLSKQEFEKMKMHAEAGDEILRQIKFPFPVANYVRSHHERWDGKGYPDGLKGEEIPIGARILAVADAFDAIRSSRPYKLSFGIHDSTELLRAQAGTVYDPHLIDLFLAHLDELETEAQGIVQNLPELSFRKYFEKVDRAIASANNSSTSQHHAGNPAELVQLFEICSNLGRYMDFADILPTIVRRIERLVPFTTCAVYADNGDDSLAIIHATGKYAKTLEGVTIGMGKGISGWVAAYRRPIINTAPSLDFQDLPGDFTPLTDALIVPMLMDGGCVGTISLYAQLPISYTQNHLRMMETVASALAPLIVKRKSERAGGDAGEIIDPITKTYRVAYLAVTGSQMVGLAERNQSPLSLLCLDVKNLAQTINLYGSSTGDMVLRKVADSLRAELRETDVLVRYGHSGFVALLPGVRADQAFRCAQRLQQQIRSASAGSFLGHSILIECQTAVASYPSDGTSIFALLQSAQRIMTSPVPSIHSQDDEAQIIEFPPRF
jgi:diguanylate cyclase (GGDEF)-like protein/putative nucleotidyltransferase with HDIG domain